jgi:hypothetical protein
MRAICRAASITARWPRWTPSKLPIATTAPLGIAAVGVVSRIMVKPGIMCKEFFSKKRFRVKHVPGLDPAMAVRNQVYAGCVDLSALKRVKTMDARVGAGP